MLYSMTGYGIAKQSFDTQTLSVELRSLNSRNFDLRLRLPNAYQAYELELRKLLQNELQRGKVDLVITMETNSINEYKINQTLLESYLEQLSNIAAANGIDKGDILQTAARMPNLINSHEIEIGEEQWEELKGLVMQAIEKFNAFRLQEGEVLLADVKNNIETIVSLQQQVIPFEAERIEKVRQRLRTQLEQLSIKVDENRFEQEIIFYLEKYDISEEKVRLTQHCNYFLEEINLKQPLSKGNKLNFITQEIGREINTLGSKANHADIQHLVVKMKDALEKIKEQLANIL